jgi:hypothetical protein
MEKLQKAILTSVIKKANDGTYEFNMSEETIDRDGEVIKIDGWDLKNFKKNSILLWGHRHDIPGIGVVGLAAKEDGNLVARKVRFATEGIYELADTVHGLVDDGVLKAVSVGYIPKKRTYPKQDEEDENGKGVKGKKKPRVITEEAELYELSIVNVGSNPNALAVLKSAVEKAENNPPDEWFDKKAFFAETAEAIKEDDLPEEAEENPYPAEHSCRLVEPVDGAPTRRKNGEQEHEGKKYDVIYQKQDGKWVQQAYRYPKKTWKASEARAHCKAHDGKFEGASESSIETLMERLVEKIDRLCETIEKMAKPKQKRIYDTIFAGGQDNDQKEPADKEDQIIEIVEQGDAPILEIEEVNKNE